MQDRFRFRVFDKTTNKIKNVTQITLDERQSGSMCDVKDKVTAHLIYQPHYVLMQCTGLKDQNGKLIYEGDIVKRFHVSSSMQGRIFIGYVTYDDTRCRFHIQEDKHCGYITFSDTDDIFEVIGNIYENPELLEVQNADNE